MAFIATGSVGRREAFDWKASRACLCAACRSVLSPGKSHIRQGSIILSVRLLTLKGDACRAKKVPVCHESHNADLSMMVAHGAASSVGRRGLAIDLTASHNNITPRHLDQRGSL